MLGFWTRHIQFLDIPRMNMVLRNLSRRAPSFQPWQQRSAQVAANRPLTMMPGLVCSDEPSVPYKSRKSSQRRLDNKYVCASERRPGCSSSLIWKAELEIVWSSGKSWSRPLHVRVLDLTGLQPKSDMMPAIPRPNLDNLVGELQDQLPPSLSTLGGLKPRISHASVRANQISISGTPNQLKRPFWTPLPWAQGGNKHICSGDPLGASRRAPHGGGNPRRDRGAALAHSPRVPDIIVCLRCADGHKAGCARGLGPTSVLRGRVGT